MLRLGNFPQVGHLRATDGPGVRYIVDVPQLGLAPPVSGDEGDARRLGLDPAPHDIVPQLHFGASGGVRALGIDQKLFIKTIFMETGRRVQIAFPTFRTLRHVMSGPAGQL